LEKKRLSEKPAFTAESKTMNQHTRRDFLKSASLLPLCAAGIGLGTVSAMAFEPIKRVGGSALKVSLNAYSFSKLLNDQNKQRSAGISLFDLLDFCAKYNFDGCDPTGYFFPTYPEVPPDDYVNRLKRRAFELGIGISGTGVRNNFTVPDKAKRAADVQHIKQWVEVASRLGAPVVRVFADTQMRGQSWQTVAPGATHEQMEEWIAENLKECAEHGKKYGVIIGVQNHGDFLKTGDNLLSLINRVNSDWCGAIVDTGYFRSDDPYKDMAKVAPYAVNWQIKKSPLGVEAEDASPTDMKKLLRIIRQSGYRGYLPIETLSIKSKNGEGYDPYTAVPKFLKELRDAIAATA
jgi:sugar phosphate isomerase/epimerase